MVKNNPPINVSVTFRHTDSSEALKRYAVEKISHCIGKYVSHPTDAHVILTVEKRDHIAEANIHSKGYDVSGKSVTQDLYSSIDKVVDNVDAQLRKRKEKLSDHKH